MPTGGQRQQGPTSTLHIRETGMLLKVLSMLAFTPGGGSNTKMRPARSRFTGTWEDAVPVTMLLGVHAAGTGSQAAHQHPRPRLHSPWG